MSLSEQEQQALREIEQSLMKDDPTFGAAVSEDLSFGGGRGAVTLRGIALIVVGICMMVGGIAATQISMWFVALSVAGFLVMFGAGVWMLRGRKSGSSAPASATGSRSSSRGNGVSDRLEENFRRRFEER